MRKVLVKYDRIYKPGLNLWVNQIVKKKKGKDTRYKAKKANLCKLLNKTKILKNHLEKTVKKRAIQYPNQLSSKKNKTQTRITPNNNKSHPQILINSLHHNKQLSNHSFKACNSNHIWSSKPFRFVQISTKPLSSSSTEWNQAKMSNWVCQKKSKCFLSWEWTWKWAPAK